MTHIKYLLIGLAGILKWLIQLVRKPVNESAQLIISVENNKYIKYTTELVAALRAKGVDVKYYIWDDAGASSNPVGRLPEVRSQPLWWTKVYWKAALACWFIDAARGAIKHYRPKKILVIEGDSYQHHIFGHYGMQGELQCYCLQWGYVGTSVPKIGWRNMPYTKFLVWGSFFRDRFEVHNKETDIIEVGHPTLTNTEEPTSKVILFAVQSEMLPFITNDHISKFVHLAIKTASEIPNITVRIRTHPNHPIEDKEAYDAHNIIEWHSFQTHSLEESLIDAAVCVTISSTLAFEGAFYETVPIFLKIDLSRTLQVHRDAENAPNNTDFYTATPDNLTQVIQKAMQINSENISDALFTSTSNESIQNIINEIMDD